MWLLRSLAMESIKINNGLLNGKKKIDNEEKHFCFKKPIKNTLIL